MLYREKESPSFFLIRKKLNLTVHLLFFFYYFSTTLQHEQQSHDLLKQRGVILLLPSEIRELFEDFLRYPVVGEVYQGYAFFSFKAL